MESLVETDQRGGSGQLVLAQNADPCSSLHPIPGALENSQKSGPFSIAASPRGDEAHHRLDSGSRQPAAIFFARESLKRGCFVSGVYSDCANHGRTSCCCIMCLVTRDLQAS